MDNLVQEFANLKKSHSRISFLPVFYVKLNIDYRKSRAAQLKIELGWGGQCPICPASRSPEIIPRCPQETTWLWGACETAVLITLHMGKTDAHKGKGLSWKKGQF